MKKIGVITSGGDCGGLNAVVKGAAQMANRFGITPYIIPNGYAGLYNLINMDKLVKLDITRLDGVDISLAGSDAGHSRVKISKLNDENKYERIKEGLKKFGIDALLIAGGDDTGSVVVDLSDNGIKCVHCPKTMDLDLQCYSVGGDSAINRIAQFAGQLKTTGRTHNRIMILEVFGRYFGHTAFRAGLAASADCILIPEIPANFDVVYDHMFDVFSRRIRSSDVKAGTYLIVVSEGLKSEDGDLMSNHDVEVDAFGHKILGGAGDYVKKILTEKMAKDPKIKDFMKEVGMFVETQYEAPEARVIRPTHLVRCGFTTSVDVNFGLEVGGGAIHLLKEGISGVTIIDVEGHDVLYMPTKKAIKERAVNTENVSFFEELGTCFGRKAVPFKPSFIKYEGHVKRVY